MYCVKCKKKVNVEDPAITKEVTSKGKPMLRAKCPACGTKMTKFTK
jgi:DNA-directed RNA polymerase subunit RPC12/RpoP